MPVVNELLPCPFCGEAVRFSAFPATCRQGDPYNSNDRAFPIVRCLKCYAEVPGKNFPTPWNSTMTAIVAWNTRAAQDSKKE